MKIVPIFVLLGVVLLNVAYSQGFETSDGKFSGPTKFEGTLPPEMREGFVRPAVDGVSGTDMNNEVSGTTIESAPGLDSLNSGK